MNLQGIKAEVLEKDTEEKGNPGGRRRGRQPWAVLDHGQGESWRLSSTHILASSL